MAFRQSFSPEERLVLALGGQGPGQSHGGPDDLSALPDFVKVLRLADHNGVTPFLYRNLEGVAGIPGDVMERLRNSYHHNLVRNARHMGEMLRIVAALRQGGVDVIPLKGSIASDVVFGDIGLYPTSDIDLLVRPADLERAGELLLTAGYRTSQTRSSEDELRSSYHLTYGSDAFIVEVHWNLVTRYLGADPDFWWEDARTMPYEGRELTMLAPEKYLLYGIFRLFARAFVPLRYLIFVEGLIRTYRQELRWPKLLADAERLGMKGITLFTLRLLHDLRGLDMPDLVQRKTTHGYPFFRNLVVTGFFGETARIHVRMLLYTALLDTPLRTARVNAQRIFPDLSEIRLRYNLPHGSMKTYLWSMLNPFILLFRKEKRTLSE